MADQAACACMQELRHTIAIGVHCRWIQSYSISGRHDGEYDCYGATREYSAGLSMVTDVRCRMLLMRQQLATQGTSPSRKLSRGPNFRKIPAHGYCQILHFRSTPLEHCTGLMISCL